MGVGLLTFYAIPTTAVCFHTAQFSAHLTAICLCPRKFPHGIVLL